MDSICRPRQLLVNERLEEMSSRKKHTVWDDASGPAVLCRSFALRYATETELSYGIQFRSSTGGVLKAVDAQDDCVDGLSSEREVRVRWYRGFV